MENLDLITRIVVETIKGGLDVPVGVSARHIHLSDEHLFQLFGEGYALQPIKDLMGGEYASKETVTLVAERSMEKVRILGPTRKQTQLELSKSDAIKLGVAAPYRDSGDLKGSAPIAVIGPKGAVYLKEGCIIPLRHIHMPPDMGWKDGEFVSVKTDGPRGLTLDNIKVRVDPGCTLELHIDTDEGNACGLKTGERVILCSCVK